MGKRPAGEGDEDLCKGLLLEAEKLSKHSNLRKWRFLLTGVGGGSQEMGWGGWAPFQEAAGGPEKGIPCSSLPPDSPRTLSRVCLL